MANSNRYSSFVIIFVSLLLLIAVIGMASFVKKQETDGPITVIVSILPQAEFVEAVGGNQVSITVMVPPGHEPHTYEPTSEQMRDLENADIYFKMGSGIDFELVWLKRFQEINPNMLIIDGSTGVDLLPMADSQEGGLDPHIWLSPLNAKIIVQNFLNGLLDIDSKNASYYESNALAYLNVLDELDYDISLKLSTSEERQFLAYHPAWGYFAERYDLEQIPIEEEGKEPTAYSISRIIDQAKEHDINVVLVSPEFSSIAAEQIADEIGGTVIKLDPLAKNYLNNMNNIALKILGGED